MPDKSPYIPPKYDEPPSKPPRLSNTAGGTASTMTYASSPPPYASGVYNANLSSSYDGPSKKFSEVPLSNIKSYETSNSDMEGGKPFRQDSGSPSDEIFSTKPVWNDVWAAVLFLACLGAFIGVGILMIIRANSSQNYTGSFWNSKTSFGLLYIALTCTGLSMIMASGYLIFLHMFPIFMIYMTLVVSTLIYLSLAILAFSKHNLWLGILCIIAVVFHVLLYFVWKKRIPFAAAMIKTTSQISFDYKSTYVAAFTTLFIEAILTGFWIVSAVAATLYYGTHSAPMIAIYVFFLFTFYWYSQVIKNTLHLTISGLFASVYLLSGTSRLFARPLLRAAKNALSYSFGSVCFGSLVVAVVQTLRALITTFSRDDSALFAFCMDCILSILESIVRLFNQYAFTQIAIFGKSYVRAARDTWHMFKRSGFEVIINTNIVTHVILLGGTMVGSICGILAGVWGLYAYTSSAMDNVVTYTTLMVLVGFFIGFTITIVLLEVIESGVATTLVLLAEEPESIKRTKPDLFVEFEATYGRHL